MAAPLGSGHGVTNRAGDRHVRDGRIQISADHILRQLSHVSLFQGLTPLQISEIARRAERVIYNPGATIIEENAEGDAAVLIISGQTVRVSGPELTARTSPIAEGSLLGEFAMLVETTYSSTVVARDQVRALRITRDELHAQIAEDRDLADCLVQKIVGRLSRMAVVLRQIDATLARSADATAKSSVSRSTQPAFPVNSAAAH
ncbi:MAG: cyclic nucleotide-binding domain-containing protein [Hyphomicrobiaceae bacterium]|nr:cyclic nucleotide-binding domain-containing protein [Hyphomicrobiaceae bacterium]